MTGVPSYRSAMTPGIITMGDIVRRLGRLKASSFKPDTFWVRASLSKLAFVMILRAPARALALGNDSAMAREAAGHQGCRYRRTPIRCARHGPRSQTADIGRQFFDPPPKRR